MDFSSLGGFLESRLAAQQKKNEDYGNAEFEVEAIIGVKPDPGRKKGLLYLTTFAGCALHDTAQTGAMNGCEIYGSTRCIQGYCLVDMESLILGGVGSLT